MIKSLAASLALLTAGAFSMSTASAYDDCTYRVKGVAYNDVLNIRAWPSPRSRIVGHIPPNGDDVALIRRKGRWGLIEYNGVEGWSHMGYLREICD
ncbi:MAG: SH3 domain-containing protein [Hyphomicrobiales bacterium]|nr:SH3 domain-containing protein [Hyphomicrobiales bacterium]